MEKKSSPSLREELFLGQFRVNRLLTISKKWIVACAHCGCLYHQNGAHDRCPACKSTVSERIDGLTEL